jgi:DNA-binding response OmpR family regulator
MFALDLLTSDKALDHALTEQFRAMDAASVTFSSLAAAEKAWKDRTPALILLDAALLNATSGASLIEALENLTPAPRLVFLGVPPNDLDAPPRSDFFPKPFRLGRLLARIRLLQNTPRTDQAQNFKLGPWLFKPEERLVLIEGADERERLTEKESALLARLCEAEGKLTREDLLASVWGYDSEIDTHTLETHIYKLRRKLMIEREDVPEDDLFEVDQGFIGLNPAWIKS